MFGIKVPNRRKYADYRPWRFPYVYPGADSQSLLCSESMFPSSDESARYRNESDLPSWKRDGLKSCLKYSAHLTQNGKDKLRGSHLVAKDLRIRDRANHCLDPRTSAESSRGEGDGAARGTDGRMTTNGVDRSAMTGSQTTTSDNLTWLSDVAPGCQAQAQRAPSSIITSIAGSHDPHLMLPGAPHAPGSSISSLFRPPSLSGDQIAHQRLYSSGQYAPIYSTTGSTLSPYSPSLYSSQSAQLSLSPYGAFYHQYPLSYSASSNAALLASHSYPHLDQSYSAALASMTSHAQHAAGQSHLPRSSFLPAHLPHAYSALTPTSSPRPLTPSQSLTGHLDPHRRETKSPKSELSRSGHPPSPSSKDSKGRGHTPPPHAHHHAKHSLLKDMSDSKDPGYQSSRKHRLLRPPDLPPGQFAEPRPMGPPGYPVMHHKDEPTAKRQKGNIGHPPPLYPAPGSSAGGGPTLGHYPTPHYPPHFMKGSIIQLANGELRRVEELRTDDFVNSADISSDLKIDSSTVVRIEENVERGTAILGFSVGQHRVQVTVEATMEHPFFVFGQGWSSCSPDRTSQRYGLTCHKLSVGDVCISLTHKDVNSRAAELSSREQDSERTNQISERGSHGYRDGRHGARSSSEHLLLPETSRRGFTTLGSVTYPRTVEGLIHTPSGGDTSQPPPSRKRRWSAPDQISVDSAVAVTSSKVLTSSSKTDNNNSSTSGATTDSNSSSSPRKKAPEKATSDSSHA